MVQSKKKEHVTPEKGNGIVIQHLPGYFLITCLIIISVFLYFVYEPFLTALILAAIVATVFRPLYRRMLKLMKKREGLASFATCVLISVLIIVPLAIFILLLTRQATDTYLFIREKVSEGALDWIITWKQGSVLYDSLGWVSQQMEGIINLEEIDIKGSIIGLARDVAQFLAAQSGAILKSFGWFVISFFIMLFAMYYMFKNGKQITNYVAALMPLPSNHKHEIFKKFKEMSMAAFYGIFITSVVQGLIGGIGFTIVGIPNAVFWGTAIAIFSLVPVLGTAIIWAPAGIILLASGHIWQGVFILTWGAGIVSTVDNFLRAYLIGERTKTNQLLMFLAVWGGIFLFGLVGVIFGPLILTLFFTFLYIYEVEYKEIGKNK